MGQPRIVGIVVLFAIAVLAVVVMHKPAALPKKVVAISGIRVASITPAGTDLLIGIGAGDRLVGVSNYDDDREGTAGKPRIGDYQTINWEKLSGLGANVLVLQYAQDRLPAYIQQQCDAMGIKIVNLKLDTIDDIYREMITLGDAVGDPKGGRGRGGSVAGEAGPDRRAGEEPSAGEGAGSDK